jgi:hypothetical protein
VVLLSAGQPTINGEFLEAKVTFTGLPEHNTDFGLKAAKLKKAGSTVATAKFEVFFPKNGKNHPGGQTGSENWFHYWREGGVCGIPLNTSTFSDVPANNPYLMAVTYPQSGDPIIRFTTNAAKELTQRQYLGKGGRGSIIVRSNCKGIHCVAVTVEHEQTHMNDYAHIGGREDSDHDIVANADEPTRHGINTDPSDPDTYSVGVSYGDDEIRAQKMEGNNGVLYYPASDWANPGCQSANQYGPLPP